MSVYFSIFQADSVSTKVPVALSPSITPSLSAATAFYNFMYLIFRIANQELLNCLQNCAFPEANIFKAPKPLHSLTMLMEYSYFSNFQCKSFLEIIEYFVTHPIFRSEFGLVHLNSISLTNYFNLDDLISSTFTEIPEVIAVQNSLYDLKFFRETFEYFGSKLVLEGEIYSLIAVAAKKNGVYHIAVQGLDWIDLHRMGYSEKFRTWGKVFLAFSEAGLDAETFFYKKKTGKISRWIDEADYISIESLLKTQKLEIWAHNNYELLVSKNIFSPENSKERIDKEKILREYEEMLGLFKEKSAKITCELVEVEEHIENTAKEFYKVADLIQISEQRSKETEEFSKTPEENIIEENELFEAAKLTENDAVNTKLFDEVTEFRDFNEVSETIQNSRHIGYGLDETTKHIDLFEIRSKEYDEAIVNNEKGNYKYNEDEDFRENFDSRSKENDEGIVNHEQRNNKYNEDNEFREKFDSRSKEYDEGIVNDEQRNNKYNEVEESIENFNPRSKDIEKVIEIMDGSDSESESSN